LQYPKDFESKDKHPVFDLSKGDNREHTAVVCFSSGTLGKPKGVELTHYNLIASLAGIRSSDPSFYNSENRGVFFAPLCHIYGKPPLFSGLRLRIDQIPLQDSTQLVS